MKPTHMRMELAGSVSESCARLHASCEIYNAKQTAAAKALREYIELVYVSKADRDFTKLWEEFQVLDTNSFYQLPEVKVYEESPNTSQSSNKQGRFSRFLCCFSTPQSSNEDPSKLSRLCVREKDLNRLVKKVQEKQRRGCPSELAVAKVSAADQFNHIKELREKLLGPHLDQLRKGLKHYWEKKLCCYDKQSAILTQLENGFLVQVPPHIYLRSGKKLKAALQEWHECLCDHVLSQKNYIKNLHDWATQPPPAPFLRDEKSKTTNSLFMQKWSRSMTILSANVGATNAIHDLTNKVGELVELHKKDLKLAKQHHQLLNQAYRYCCKIEKDIPRVNGHEAIKPLAPLISCVLSIRVADVEDDIVVINGSLRGSNFEVSLLIHDPYLPPDQY